MNGWLCTSLLLAVALGGCVGDGSGDKTGEADAGSAVVPERPATIPWGLSGCKAAVALFDVPAEKVRPHLPDGFKPLPPAIGIAGATANPSGGGSFGVEMLTCESGIGLNETLEQVAYGSYFAFVDPPAELRDPHMDLHFVKWDVLVPDAPRHALLAEAGGPVRNGTASFASFVLDGSVGSIQGDLDMDGLHRFEGTTFAPGPDQSRFIEFTAVGDGLASWSTLMTTTASGMGHGTVTSPAGSLAAEVLGSGPADGLLLVLYGAFEAGEIHLPPRPAPAEP